MFISRSSASIKPKLVVGSAENPILEPVWQTGVRDSVNEIQSRRRDGTALSGGFGGGLDPRKPAKRSRVARATQTFIAPVGPACVLGTKCELPHGFEVSSHVWDVVAEAEGMPLLLPLRSACVAQPVVNAFEECIVNHDVSCFCCVDFEGVELDPLVVTALNGSHGEFTQSDDVGLLRPVHRAFTSINPGVLLFGQGFTIRTQSAPEHATPGGSNTRMFGGGGPKGKGKGHVQGPRRANLRERGTGGKSKRRDDAQPAERAEAPAPAVPAPDLDARVQWLAGVARRRVLPPILDPEQYEGLPNRDTKARVGGVYAAAGLLAERFRNTVVAARRRGATSWPPQRLMRRVQHALGDERAQLEHAADLFTISDGIGSEIMDPLGAPLCGMAALYSACGKRWDVDAVFERVARIRMDALNPENAALNNFPSALVPGSDTWAVMRVMPSGDEDDATLLDFLMNTVGDNAYMAEVAAEFGFNFISIDANHQTYSHFHSAEADTVLLRCDNSHWRYVCPPTATRSRGVDYLPVGDITLSADEEAVCGFMAELGQPLKRRSEPLFAHWCEPRTFEITLHIAHRYDEDDTDYRPPSSAADPILHYDTQLDIGIEFTSVLYEDAGVRVGWFERCRRWLFGRRPQHFQRNFTLSRLMLNRLVLSAGQQRTLGLSEEGAFLAAQTLRLTNVREDLLAAGSLHAQFYRLCGFNLLTRRNRFAAVNGAPALLFNRLAGGVNMQGGNVLRQAHWATTADPAGFYLKRPEAIEIQRERMASDSYETCVTKISRRASEMCAKQNVAGVAPCGVMMCDMRKLGAGVIPATNPVTLAQAFLGRLIQPTPPFDSLDEFARFQQAMISHFGSTWDTTTLRAEIEDPCEAYRVASRARLTTKQIERDVAEYQAFRSGSMTNRQRIKYATAGFFIKFESNAKMKDGVVCGRPRIICTMSKLEAFETCQLLAPMEHFMRNSLLKEYVASILPPAEFARRMRYLCGRVHNNTDYSSFETTAARQLAVVSEKSLLDYMCRRAGYYTTGSKLPAFYAENLRRVVHNGIEGYVMCRKSGEYTTFFANCWLNLSAIFWCRVVRISRERSVTLEEATLALFSERLPEAAVTGDDGISCPEELDAEVLRDLGYDFSAAAVGNDEGDQTFCSTWWQGGFAYVDIPATLNKLCWVYGCEGLAMRRVMYLLRLKAYSCHLRTCGGNNAEQHPIIGALIVRIGQVTAGATAFAGWERYVDRWNIRTNIIADFPRTFQTTAARRAFVATPRSDHVAVSEELQRALEARLLCGDFDVMSAFRGSDAVTQLLDSARYLDGALAEDFMPFGEQLNHPVRELFGMFAAPCELPRHRAAPAWNPEQPIPQRP